MATHDRKYRERASAEPQAKKHHASGTRAQFKDNRYLAHKDKTLQRQTSDDDELMQGKFTPLQAAVEDEEETLQPKSSTGGAVAQHAAKNNTGLPDNLKSGIENLSGMSMDSVRVHQNSSKPAEVGAHAFAQGTDIHVAPGQMQHLPHEAWHVVQQAQGRVPVTTNVAGIPVNDNPALESEADKMGSEALKNG